MKVINLFAAPGTGKTATGQILSGLLSIANYKVEYIPEFAKFATLAKNDAALSDQIYMFGKQENRLHVLKRKTELDYVVMDGPIPLALLFHPETHYKSYEPLVMEVFRSYDNLNFYLRRNRSYLYQEHGRNETLEESLELDIRLRALLQKHSIETREFMVEETLPFHLFEVVTGHPAPVVATAFK